MHDVAVAWRGPRLMAGKEALAGWAGREVVLDVRCFGEGLDVGGGGGRRGEIVSGETERVEAAAYGVGDEGVGMVLVVAQVEVELGGGFEDQAVIDVVAHAEGGIDGRGLERLDLLE